MDFVCKISTTKRVYETRLLQLDMPTRHVHAVSTAYVYVHYACALETSCVAATVSAYASAFARAFARALTKPRLYKAFIRASTRAFTQAFTRAARDGS